MLHLMLRQKCLPENLEPIVSKFNELNLSVDNRNYKDMTPLHILCSYLYTYRSDDQPVEISKILLDAGADKNNIVKTEALTDAAGTAFDPR